MRKAFAVLALTAFVATPAMADLIPSTSGLQVSTEVYTGDTSKLFDNRVPLGTGRALTGIEYGVGFLGQSTLGGAGFLEDSSGDGTNFYDGNVSNVGVSFLPGADVITVQEFEVVNPASQPLASLQVQVMMSSTNRTDLLPAGFTFTNGNPIDRYRMDTGFAGGDEINPDNGTFDVIDAFFVLFDAAGGILGQFNMVNGTIAGTTGVTTLGDASIIGPAGAGVTDILQVWNITPEPATLALLGIGGLAIIRRRRA